MENSHHRLRGDHTLVFVEVKTRTGDGFEGLRGPSRRRSCAGSGGWRESGSPVSSALARAADRCGGCATLGRRRDPEITHLRGSADGAGTRVFGRGAWTGRRDRRDRSRHHLGLPGVHLVGLPDAALQESRNRVCAAITNCGNKWPMSRLTLALSPATLPKTGCCTTSFGLCGAVGRPRQTLAPAREGGAAR